ncbi:hypothetical protein RMB13_09110 [Acinetobacter sp. V102_4]|uniref:hypothetical protein n=1 Tax=Acinetobacter sp. V102_4 TaxID=3072984 RepID=UPI00287D590F|nr:hypothetical protein [Acinetobacter sp. V102_4]MDS7929635.1 hypothetical protein [Acinetobacter sp. V102_4]
MMPDHALSTVPVASEFMTPARTDSLTDYEYGGVGLGDLSQGLYAKLWTCFYADGAIQAKHDDVVEHLIVVENVTALSFAFDRNMRPMVAYIAAGQCYLWWYDSLVANQVTSNLGATLEYPQLALDDRRDSQSGNADVIFAYIKDHKTYIRLQRERFRIEHELAQASRLIQIGMMKNNRFGFALYTWNKQ